MTAPRIRRRLRRHGYDNTVEWLEQRRQPTVADVKEALARAQIAKAMTTFLPGDYDCLDRSVLVWWLTGRTSQARVRFGTRSNDEGPGLEFHAWVEMEGVVLNDVSDVAESYQPFQGPPRG